MTATAPIVHRAPDYFPTFSGADIHLASLPHGPGNGTALSYSAYVVSMQLSPTPVSGLRLAGLVRACSWVSPEALSPLA